MITLKKGVGISNLDVSASRLKTSEVYIFAARSQRR
jgi:hypothetical protein